MSYVFHPAAEVEHLESIAHYESKRPGLGASYLAEFEGILVHVCESPHRYPVEMKPDLQRVQMKRFPVLRALSRRFRHYSSISSCSSP